MQQQKISLKKFYSRNIFLTCKRLSVLCFEWKMNGLGDLTCVSYFDLCDFVSELAINLAIFVSEVAKGAAIVGLGVLGAGAAVAAAPVVLGYVSFIAVCSDKWGILVTICYLRIAMNYQATIMRTTFCS